MAEVQLSYDSKANGKLMNGGEVRSYEVRQTILDTKKRIEQDYLYLSDLLLEARDGQYYKNWGFNSAIEYYEQELGVNARKAQYLISISEAVRDLGLEGKKDLIEQIGWTKMRMLVNPMRDAVSDGDHGKVTKLLTQAETMTVKDLQSYIRGQRLPNAPDGKVSISFKADESNSGIIFDALDTAKADIETHQIDMALAHICYDYLQRQDSGCSRAELPDVINWVKTVYGVELAESEVDPAEAFV